MKRTEDVKLSPDETKRLAYGCGVICIAIAVLCLAIGIAKWRPLIEIYRPSHPFGLTLVELAAWFAVTAWLCFRPPFNGMILMVGGIAAAIVLANLNGRASVEHEPWPVALGPLVFSAGGLMMILVAKISTDTQFRRPFWQEAWPGVALLIAGGLAAGVLHTELPLERAWVPPAAVPAEAG